MTAPWRAALLAMLVAGLGTPVVIAWLRRLAVVDLPNHRSSHDVATVRGGGIAVVAGVGAGLLATSSTNELGAVACLSLLFAFLGLVDDFRNLSPLARLPIQVVVASVVSVVLVDRSGLAAVAVTIAVVLWVVGFVNSFNFMDGVNGISALTATALGATWWAIGAEAGLTSVALGGAAITGAALGFLPWNAPRARVFLGDVGAYAIGAWTALLAVVAWSDGIEWWLAVLPSMIYVSDTSVTAVRRVVRGERWYESHREHAYQRLVDAGWSHLRSALFAAACTGIIGLATVSAVADRFEGLGAIAVTGAVVAAYLMAPGLVKRRGGRVSNGAVV